MSDEDPRKCLAEGMLCDYENCDRPATVIACGRIGYGDRPSHPEPGVYCEPHAADVADERSPEYVETCPNCCCRFGVN